MGLIAALVLPIAKRWIAGENRSDAIHAVEESNENGIHSIVDYLGEHVQSRDQAKKTLHEYVELLKALDRKKLDYSISIKLTQFGLAFSPKECALDVKLLLNEAKQRKRFVWLDMEESAFTQEAIDLYLQWHKKFPRLGICLQSYLKRSLEDAQLLAKHGGIVRIVKGAYHESESIAFNEMSDIDHQFGEMFRVLLHANHRVAVGTHDSVLVEYAWKLSHGKNVEFQFLRGIRPDLKKKMLERKARVSEYIPYGPQWFAFSKRRLLERKRNILTVFRSWVGV